MSNSFSHRNVGFALEFDMIDVCKRDLSVTILIFLTGGGGFSSCSFSKDDLPTTPTLTGLATLPLFTSRGYDTISVDI